MILCKDQPKQAVMIVLIADKADFQVRSSMRDIS